MAKVGFAVPVLPGKEDLATIHSIEEIRRRQPEYEESRHRAGVTVERVYLQGNPDGSKGTAKSRLRLALAKLETVLDRQLLESS